MQLSFQYLALKSRTGELIGPFTLKFDHCINYLNTNELNSLQHKGEPPGDHRDATYGLHQYINWSGYHHLQQRRSQRPSLTVIMPSLFSPVSTIRYIDPENSTVPVEMSRPASFGRRHIGAASNTTEWISYQV